ncbi:MAG: peptide MFS transporter [Elusimicrobia bacterium]|nr:peptide MFS transporter [Elusimicrobiota bacterium]
MSDTTHKPQPRALHFISGVQMFERFNYYGMLFLLMLFLTSPVIGLNVRKAGLFFGTFTSIVYITPVLGGFLADKFLGKQRSIILGGVLSMLGQFTLASYGLINNYAALTLGLALIILGTGFFKANISSITGDIYEENDNRRDSGFTIFYMYLNIGAFFAPLVCSYLGEKIAFRYGFMAAGAGMFLGLMWFLLGRKKFLGNTGLKPSMEEHKNKEGKNEPLTKAEKDRIIVILILTFFSVFFWAFYEQSGSSLTLFAERATDRIIFGWEMPVGWLQAVPSLFVVILAPVFAWFWIKLGDKDPSTPAKFVWSLFLLGAGYIVIAAGAFIFQKSGVPVSPLWLITLYFMLTLGELCISPVGLSMTTKLTPAKYASLFMGVWLASDVLGNFFGGIFAGSFESMSLVKLFSIPALTVFVCGLALWAMSGKLKEWMHGIR